MSLGKNLTSDTWILQTILGYQIEFDSFPVQTKLPVCPNWSDTEKQMITDEVDKLLKKGAIVEVESCANEFISNIFLVPKKTGDKRPVINLRYLNKFVSYFHFKMETIETVKSLIQEGDFLTSIDLTDAYFSVLIAPHFRKFLRFIWNGVRYEFICLCFGLASAPRIFTKILKPVIATLRQQGIRLSYYIDDSIIAAKSFTQSLQFSSQTRTMYESLGFTINGKKSSLVPSQTLVYLGFVWDTVHMKISLPIEKVEKIVEFSRYVLRSSSVTIRCLARLIGLYVSSFPAVLLAPFFYRELEKCKTEHLNRFDKNFEAHAILSDAAKLEN